MWLSAFTVTFLRCMRYYTTSDFKEGKWIPRQGVKKYVRYSPRTTDIAKISIKKVFADMINFFIKKGYKDGETVLGAGYDWTEFPSDEWISSTKETIEKAYNKEKKKVVLIAHSMGAPCSYYFLKKMNDNDANWVTKYIYKYIPIAPAWAGSPVPLKEMFYAEMLNEFLVPGIKGMISEYFGMIKNKNRRRQDYCENSTIEERDGIPFYLPKFPTNAEISMWVRHLPGMWILLPWKEAYGDNEVLAINRDTGDRYTFGQLVSFIQLFIKDKTEIPGMLSDSQTRFIKAVNNYEWIPPVPIRIFYGVGVKTPIGISFDNNYEEMDFHDKESIWKNMEAIESTEGDGTVPVQSLSYAGKKWENNGDVRTYVRPNGFKEHKDILRDVGVINTIMSEIDENYAAECEQVNKYLHIWSCLVGIVVGIITTIVTTCVIVCCCCSK